MIRYIRGLDSPFLFSQIMISIPFHGHKKTSYKYVKTIVEEYGYKSVYEPFGGSGVLSVNLFKDGLVDRAVVNDYDRFFDEYEQYLDYKDWVVKNCEEHGLEKTTSCKKYGCYKRVNGEVIKLKTRLLSKDDKEYLQSLIKQVPYKYWRYLALGNNFCFGAVVQCEEIKLSDFRYFNGYLKTDKQREYLKWLEEIELTSLDYKDFLDKYGSDFDENTLLIIDPPYLGTSQVAYEGQFDMEDTKELIEILKDLKIDFIFFNDNEELIDSLLGDLEVSYNDSVGTGNSVNSRGIKRCDHFALVQF